jgi:c-di-GMP-binding flagellar brake protein YcgR
VQRREFFRVDIPAGNPAHCVIEHPSMPSKMARFRIADISAGGLQLVDKDNLLVDVPVGTIYEECTLELPDVGQLDLSLRVLRSTELLQDNGKPQHQVACRFFNLPDNRQITIQQYIGTLERAVLARRWGME